MSNTWAWIFGIAFGLMTLVTIATVRSTRESYWAIRGAAMARVAIVQEVGDRAELWQLHHYYER